MAAEIPDFCMLPPSRHFAREGEYIVTCLRCLLHGNQLDKRVSIATDTDPTIDRPSDKTEQLQVSRQLARTGTTGHRSSKKNPHIWKSLTKQWMDT
jgi:hypothetical protein